MNTRTDIQISPDDPPDLKSDTRQTGWRRANPLKYRAHLAVHKALSTGQLTKQGCEVCGTARVDAHHDDYDRPLTVRWLCRRHHTMLHHYGEDMFPLTAAASDCPEDG